MSIPRMAAAITRELAAGKRVAILVADSVEGDEVFRELRRLRAHGQLMFLFANVNNGLSWLTMRFDSAHATTRARASDRGRDLEQEIRVRTAN